MKPNTFVSIDGNSSYDMAVELEDKRWLTISASRFQRHTGTIIHFVNQPSDRFARHPSLYVSVTTL